jgi:hypothetical protein
MPMPSLCQVPKHSGWIQGLGAILPGGEVTDRSYVHSGPSPIYRCPPHGTSVSAQSSRLSPRTFFYINNTAMKPTCINLAAPVPSCWV